MNHVIARFVVSDFGRSRMREFRLSGSVRGALSNGRPYREHQKNRIEIIGVFCSISQAQK